MTTAEEMTLSGKIDQVISGQTAAATEREAMQKKLASIHRCVEGDPGDHTSDGMKGDVNRNSRFRKNFTKILLVSIPVIPALMTLIIWLLSNRLVAQIIEQTVGK